MDTLTVVPYPSKETVNEWLDEMENKFNRLRIPRHRRFAATPLLVEGNLNVYTLKIITKFVPLMIFMKFYYQVLIQIIIVHL